MKPLSITTPEQLKQLTIPELQQYAGEVREFLIESISATGGHIGANLATVEMSIALHYVFQSPCDRILWDTGHQGYTHKLITGRQHLFPTLNQYRGMSRFINPQESEHDILDATHAGTAVSAAVGAALAKKLRGETGYTIAVVGDGALGEGLTLEGINHAAASWIPGLMIVLNDNGYAISPGFGALHNALQSENAVKAAELFHALNMEYIGPVDGHDVEAVVSALRQAQSAQRLPLVHLKTVKGFGLPAAAKHPYHMHFSFAFDPETGAPRTAPAAPTMTYPDAAAAVLSARMDNDPSIVAITPSTLYATGLDPIFRRWPDRCFDPGMAEQHAMTLAAGLAIGGMKPVVFYQSTFMQRAFDQLFHDICYPKLPVLILMARSGLAGYDGPTHHGIYDLSYLRCLPNLRILYPKDRFELQRMIEVELDDLSAPVAIGMPYGPADEIDSSVLTAAPETLRQAEEVLSGNDLMVFAAGSRFTAAVQAVNALRQRGLDAGLVNLRSLQPLPAPQILSWLRSVKRAVVVEETILAGGTGGAMAELLADNGVTDVSLLRLALPCRFVEAGSTAELTAAYGLDASGILKSIAKRWPDLCRQ